MINKVLFIVVFIGLHAANVAAQQKKNPVYAISHKALTADSIDLEARKLMMKLKYDSAKSNLDKALELALQSGNYNIIARCYIDYANLYNLQGKYNTSGQFIQASLPYLEKADIYEVKITGILLQANHYMLTGRKDSAVYYYKMAEEYNAEKMPYRNYLVYMSLGELYKQMNDFTEAEKYFKKSYFLTSTREGKPDHLHLLIIFLNFYLAQNKPENAGYLIEEYNLLVEERKKKNITDPLQDVLRNITESKLINSVEFMESVKKQCLNSGLLQQALLANNYLIKYYEKKKNYEKAIEFANESEDLATKTGGIYFIYESKKVKYSLLEKTGNYKEANKMADALFKLKDSILMLQKRDQLYALETKFETEKKQKKIDLLLADQKMNTLLLQQQLIQQSALARENMLMDSIVKKEKAYSALLASENGFKEIKLKKENDLMQALTRENTLQKAKVRKEKQTKWILAGSAVLLLLSGISIFSLYQKQKAKTQIIQKQSGDLEVLMKEIHHRVKNNLQIVSSLLDLQSHYINDAQASEAVKEGKNRVQSMALIHQNLYSEGNIKGIKVKEYINNLLMALCSSYNISSEKIKINVLIDDLNLDVDTMIPLGLVINELVSNAFKYAFKEKSGGELQILLKENADKLHLLIRDNGNGFPEGLDVKNSKSFGLKMIKAFAQKLKARLEIYNNNGAVVEMEIAKFKVA